MTGPVRDTVAMIAGMAPVPDPETYTFDTAADDPVRAAAALPLALALTVAAWTVDLLPAQGVGPGGGQVHSHPA